MLPTTKSGNFTFISNLGATANHADGDAPKGEKGRFHGNADKLNLLVFVIHPATAVPSPASQPLSMYNCRIIAGLVDLHEIASVSLTPCAGQQQLG